ncbi:MAG: hypothetical protein M3Z97_07710 [Candidatus Dormibacteraeota bacterium]|nr:hypothetical protein [Candidatus Dormibacteraeota bacterium]
MGRGGICGTWLCWGWVGSWTCCGAPWEPGLEPPPSGWLWAAGAADLAGWEAELADGDAAGVPVVAPEAAPEAEFGEPVRTTRLACGVTGVADGLGRVVRVPITVLRVRGPAASAVAARTTMITTSKATGSGLQTPAARNRGLGRKCGERQLGSQELSSV